MEIQTPSFPVTEFNFSLIIPKFLVIRIFFFFWSQMHCLWFMHKEMHGAALNLAAQPYSSSSTSSASSSSIAKYTRSQMLKRFTLQQSEPGGITLFPLKAKRIRHQGTSDTCASLGTNVFEQSGSRCFQIIVVTKTIIHSIHKNLIKIP